MKTKFKQFVLSFVLVLALVCGSLVGLISGITNFNVFAEYKPTSVPANPYDFVDATGWERKSSTVKSLMDSFTNSTASMILKTDQKLPDSYRPTKNYAGEDLTETERSLVMIAKDAPILVMVDKMENGNPVYKKEGDKFVYEMDGSSPKVYTKEGDNYVYTPSEGDKVTSTAASVDFEQVEGKENEYYLRLREQEETTTYYSYRNTSSLSLSENSWYVVTAYVRTVNAIASLSIGDRDDKVSFSTGELNTNGEWKEIRLFVEMKAKGSLASYITLYYGTKSGLVSGAKDMTLTDTESGCVMFDHIDVQRISQTEYNNRTIDGKGNADAIFNEADTSARKDYTIGTINPSFETREGETPFSIYEKMFGADDYVETEANQKYQYYVPKYSDDDSTKTQTKTELDANRKAYSKLTSKEIVFEKEAFETEKDKKDGGNTFNPDNHILQLTSTSAEYDLGVLSPFVTIKQFGYYRLSVWVKGKNASSKAIVNLLSYVQTGSKQGDEYTDGMLIKTSQSVTAFSEEADFTNGWVEVVFYIQGNCYHDQTIQIALLAGSNTTVYFDNLRLEAIDYSTYSSATSSTKYDLAPSSLIASGGITNGYFNYINVEDVTKVEDLELPYSPASFTKLDNNDDGVVSGIVPTMDTNNPQTGTTNYWDRVKPLIGNPELNPNGKETLGNGAQIDLPKTNVLAIYSEPSKERTFAYKTSSSFSLSSSSVYEITFYTYADKSSAPSTSNFSGEIYLNLKSNDNSLAMYSKQIESNEGGAWVKNTIVVRTGSSSRSFNLEFGVKGAKGTVYFKNIGYTKLEDTKKGDETVTVNDQFISKLQANKSLALQSENNILFVDYYGNSAVMHSSNTVEGKNYFESLFYENEDPKDATIVRGELGVVDMTKDLVLFDETSYTLSNSFMHREDSISDFAVVMYNHAAAQTKINQKYNTSLSSTSYYQISFYVKTADIEEGKGLKVLMDAISVEFRNINTGKLTDTDNEWVKYTVLVKTGSSSISNFNLSFALGEKGNEFAGTALISDIEIKKFANQTEYNEAVDAVDVNDKTTVVRDLSLTDDGNRSEDPADSNTLVIFFLVFSSLLLVAALVIALVSITIRKLPKNQTVVGENNAKVNKDKSSEGSSKDGFV